MKCKLSTACMAVACVLASSTAWATNGYFQHGYGLKAKGMGGASTATAIDSLGGSVNPAKMAFVGDRIDFGIEIFVPRREARRFGSGGDSSFGPMPGGFLDGSADSRSTVFPIPEFGFNRMLTSNLSLGVSVYGNGGMNTNFGGGQITNPAGQTTCNFFQTGVPAPAGPNNLLCGNGQLGVNLAQAVIASTVAYKFRPDFVVGEHAIGVSPLIGTQMFKALGLQAFGGLSNDPGSLTNKGTDHAFGGGVRVGYFGQLTDWLSIGGAWSSKVYMSKFKKYNGLFAENGDFDIPENFNFGLAVKPVKGLTLAADYQRILYNNVKSIGNPSANILNCAGGDTSSCLGGSNGAGFGWRNVDVFKLGVQYQYDKRWTVRGGYDQTTGPIGSRDVTFNILAPGTVRKHATLGFTYTMPTGGELTFSYMHAFDTGVTGASLFNSFGVPGGAENINMHQDAWGIAYGWKM